MHYIRILKPPRLLPVPSPPSLSAKITITTDLGESFLFSNIPLIVEFEFEDGLKVLGAEKGREYVWRGRDGMRSLELIVPIPASKGKRKIGGEMVKLSIRPKEEEFALNSFENVLSKKTAEDAGSVVGVRSMAFNVSPGAKGGQTPGVGMAERLFSMGTGDQEKGVRIWEETGESIARHIWDAGLVLSSYLSCLSPNTSLKEAPQLPVLQNVLQKERLEVLELGAGCGIVGISLFTSFRNISHVLLTDLPEATEIVSRNLSPSSTLSQNTGSRLAFQVLDWSQPLPANVSSTNWQLVVVADCTYNPDVVPDLVKTLKHLAEESKDVVVVLAMKVRHESELVFFDLMRESGFGVKEKCKIPLPVLGGEDEEIEIFVFGCEQ